MNLLFWKATGVVGFATGVVGVGKLTNKTIVMVSHLISEAIILADRIAVMKDSYTDDRTILIAKKP